MASSARPYYSQGRGLERGDYLADIMLWRNDPELAQHVEKLAMQGDLNAQYVMGLICAEGRGVDQDEVEAYAWLTVATEKGDADARLLRTVVAANMSAQQVEAGCQRAAALQVFLLAQTDDN